MKTRLTGKQTVVLLTILLVGIALRLYFLINYQLIDAEEHDVFLSDEAIVGIMARDIAAGRSLPVFFYGQFYLGALEAYLVAPLFAVFGVSVFALKVVPALFSISLLFVVYFVGARLFNATVGLMAAALVAVPSPYFFVWGFKARGGFIEHVVLSMLVLLVFSLIYFYRKNSLGMCALLGLLSGIALWVNQLVVPYLAIVAGLLWLKRSMLLSHAKATVALSAFLFGAAPLILSNLAEPLATARTLTRRALQTSGISELDTRGKLKELLAAFLGRVNGLPQAGQHLSVLFGKEGSWTDDGGVVGTMAIRNLPEIHSGYGAAIPLCFFGVALLAGLYRQGWCKRPAEGEAKPLANRARDHKLDILILVFCASLLAYFQPRYLLVCYPLAAVIAGVFFDGLRTVYGKGLYAFFLAGTILINGYGILDMALHRRQDEPVAKLIAAAEAQACRYGYSAGPMYHVAFRSLERIILVPLDKSRYPQYKTQVSEAPAICYVFRKDQERKKIHMAFLELLREEGVVYQQSSVGNYVVYHSFDPRYKISPSLLEQAKIREPSPSELLLGA
jgi:4-amino-4-deoxy-L-arabinose transferase-like glycosyltransferase